MWRRTIMQKHDKPPRSVKSGGEWGFACTDKKHGGRIVALVPSAKAAWKVPDLDEYFFIDEADVEFLGKAFKRWKRG